jgi:hypothetical protein
MPRITHVTSPDLYQKDPTPLARPQSRSEGLAHFLKQMKIGESGLIPRSVADNVHSTAKYLNLTFVVQSVDKNQSRIWRIA